METQLMRVRVRVSHLQVDKPIHSFVGSSQSLHFLPRSGFSLQSKSFSFRIGAKPSEFDSNPFLNQQERVPVEEEREKNMQEGEEREENLQEEVEREENFQEEVEREGDGEDGFSVEVAIQKTGKNSRKISASIPIQAPLELLWNVLTDYQHLADFIPGLAVSQEMERWENGARLLQIGQQDLAFGLKFRAKGIVDVRENPLEILPNGIRRDIDFEMIEGDFQVFEGTWRMEQVIKASSSSSSSSQGLEGQLPEIHTQTYLSYILEVKPKAWLPVRLIENRLSKEIKLNLVSVQAHVMKNACIAFEPRL